MLNSRLCHGRPTIGVEHRQYQQSHAVLLQLVWSRIPAWRELSPQRHARAAKIQLTIDLRPLANIRRLLSGAGISPGGPSGEKRPHPNRKNQNSRYRLHSRELSKRRDEVVVPVSWMILMIDAEPRYEIRSAD